MDRGRPGPRRGDWDQPYCKMQFSRFRGGRGASGPGNMRGPGPRGSPGFMGNRGEGKFRPPGSHGDGWNQGPHGHMWTGMGSDGRGDHDNREENILWAEAKTSEGMSYFYHTETRETTWKRPKGPGIRIILHEKVGNVTNKGYSTPHGGPETFSNGFGNSANRAGSGRPNVALTGESYQPGETGSVEFSGPGPVGPPPYNGFGQRLPPVNDNNGMPFMPNAPVPPRPNIPFGMPPQFGPTGPTFPIPDATGTIPSDDRNAIDTMAPKMPQMPPQHLPTGFPGFGPMGPPPPFVMQPPPVFAQNMPFPQPWGLLPGVSAPTSVSPPLFNAKPTFGGMDPKVIAKAQEWSEHISTDGKTYFYNSKTNASVWEKPPALLLFEEMQKTVANRSANAKESSSEKTKASVRAGSNWKDAKKLTARGDPYKIRGDKCRPISSTPVAGTPWCVVWTGDERVFFYNPSTNHSAWERPRDLFGRVDVDELLRNSPDKNGAKVKKVEATSTTSPQIEMETSSREKIKREHPEANVKSEMDNEGDPPTKKAKTEDVEVVDEESERPSSEDNEVEEIKKAEKSEKFSPEDNEDKVEEIKKAEKSEKSSPKNNEDEVEEIKKDAESVIQAKDALREVNASEAEARAAIERAKYPFEVRLKQFRDMLIEKQVSAFSAWEKELHKIVFDSRYLLLTSKERKVAYHDYVKERAEKEREEKKSRMKQMKEQFMAFLNDVQSQDHPRLTYDEFVEKYGRDSRFKAVERSRDRETYFVEHVSELKKREKEEIARSKEKHRDMFLALLKDKIFDYHLKWADVRKRFHRDSRFSMLDVEEKEDLFRIHQKKLKSEAKARKKRKKAIEKSKKLKLQQEISEENESDDVILVDYKTTVKSDPDDSKSDKMEDVSEEEEGCLTHDSDDDTKEERQRKEREAASMWEREKEVQRALAGHLRDNENEREHYRHEEAVQEFQILLTDLVKTTDITWNEVKKAAKSDRRWALVSILPKEELEHLFSQHCEDISWKKRQRFRELLEEAIDMKVDFTWRDVQERIKDDPRYVKFSSSERKCEREFEMYLKYRSSNMKTNFRKLLKETKTLSYRTKQQIRENPRMMKDIEAVLAKDRRYLEMDSMPEERHRLFVQYLDDLERKGWRLILLSGTCVSTADPQFCCVPDTN